VSGDGGGRRRKGLRPVIAVIVAVVAVDEHFGGGGEVGLGLAKRPMAVGKKASPAADSPSGKAKWRTVSDSEKRVRRVALTLRGEKETRFECEVVA